MGLIVMYHTFTDTQDSGGALTASNVNTNWQRLYTLVNGNLDQANIAPTYFLTRSGTKPTWAAGYEGQFWYDSTDHKAYVGSNATWLPGMGATGPTGPEGPTGPTGEIGTLSYTWVIAYPATGRVLGPELQSDHTVSRVYARTATAGTGAAYVTFNIDNMVGAKGTTGRYVLPHGLIANLTGVAYTGTSGSTAPIWGYNEILDKSVVDVVITAVTGEPKYVAITMVCTVEI